MPIYDYDGTTTYQIGKLYDNDGSTNYQIGKVYDNDGTTNSLIYTADLQIITNGAIQSGYSSFTHWYVSVNNSSNGYFHMYTTASQGTRHSICKTGIDVTNFSKMVIVAKTELNSADYYGSAMRDQMVGLISNTTQDTNTEPLVVSYYTNRGGAGVKLLGTSDKTYTVDISSLTGTKYIEFRIQSTGGGIVNNLYVKQLYFE